MSPIADRLRGVSGLALVALVRVAGACATPPDEQEELASDVASRAPVGTTSMPDPGVMLDINKFYAFVTGSGLQQATSTTAGGPWSVTTDTMSHQNLPAWMDKTKGVWAPDMVKNGQGKFVVYFSAALHHGAGTPAGNDAHPASDARCIGSAQAAAPTGPFVVDSHPVVCLQGYGAADDMSADPGDRVHGEGVIDASPSIVTVDGAQELFLVYKTQAAGTTSTIRMVRLSLADGITVLGNSHQLLKSTVDDQAGTIEAPSLVQNGSWFILFVAHGNFDTCDYSTQWFKSQHIWSWTNTGATTLLSKSSTGLCGPGGADVTASQVSGQRRIFFHGWVNPGTTTPSPARNDEGGAGARRVLYAAVLTFGSDGFTPVLGELLTP